MYACTQTIPPSGVLRAYTVMKTGNIFRYGTQIHDGEPNTTTLPLSDTAVSEIFSDVSISERDIAAYTGHKYAVALNSGGSAMYIALLAAGVQYGDPVLCNAFACNTVPSAIVHAGGQPVYVNITSNFCIDLMDLRTKIIISGAKYLLLSHVRGRVSSITHIKRICEVYNVQIIEDCTESFGVRWNGIHTGKFGIAACVSTQAYRILNSGEGGFLLTDDDDIAAKAILYAGGYSTRHHEMHIVVPPSDIMAKYVKRIPNYSLRMSNLTACILNPQLALINEKIGKVRILYADMETFLTNLGPHVWVPNQHVEVTPVGTSIQFSLLTDSDIAVTKFLELSHEAGLNELTLLGHDETSSNFHTWHFVRHNANADNLETTTEVIARAFDLSLACMSSSRVEEVKNILCENYNAVFKCIEF